MWTSIDPDPAYHDNKQFPRDGRTTVEFEVPETIESAKEILIFAWIRIAGAINPTGAWYYKIFVRDYLMDPDAAFYMYVFTEANYNEATKYVSNYFSENMWLPMPFNRRIYVSRLSLHGDEDLPIKGTYVYSQLRVVGYR